MTTVHGNDTKEKVKLFRLSVVFLIWDKDARFISHYKCSKKQDTIKKWTKGHH